MESNAPDIKKRKQLLDRAKEQLKLEFVGIDEVIDRVVDSLSSWYLYPELQGNCPVVSLWGLSGTGKSSLLLRLRELLDLQDRFYRLDLGERNWALQDMIENIHDNANGQPFLLALDEFQHAKTLERNGMESEKSNLRILWEILDSGKFRVLRHQKELGVIRHVQRSLDYLLDVGMVIQEGHVVQGLPLYREYFPRNGLLRERMTDKENNPFILSREQMEDIQLLTGEFENLLELEQRIGKMNGRELSSFLKKVIEKGRTPKLVDCSKAFICISGNLDEAYRIGADHDAEIDPDELHERSKRISIPEVKEALRTRFRSEQVGRMGNNHVLYPAFSSEHFREIIQQELGRIHMKVYNSEGLHLEFHRSVWKTVYEEGVFPSQGTRPVYSTIQQMIDSRLGSIIARSKVLEANVRRLWTYVEGDEWVVEFYTGKEEKVDELGFEIRRDLGQLKKSKQDDKQAVTAVHEAGHAVLGIILNKEVPDRIVSHSINNEKDGYTQFPERDREPLTKKSMENKGVAMLGGLVAEELVFGEEEVSPGSCGDLNKATKLCLKMLKEFGMGDMPGRFLINDQEDLSHSLKDDDHLMDRKAKKRLQEWKDRAKELLSEHEGLLLRIAERASHERKLEKEDLLGILQEICPGRYQEVQNQESGQNGFREVLGRRIKEHGEKKVIGNGIP